MVMADDGYPVITIHFKGKLAVVVLFLVILTISSIVVNIRGISCSDEQLLDVVKSWISTRQIGNFSGDIQKLLDDGKVNDAARLGSRIANTRVEIQSCELASPAIQYVFGWRDVVAKVSYKVTENNTVVVEKTEYFELHKNFVTGAWFCAGKVSKIFYYLNLISDE